MQKNSGIALTQAVFFLAGFLSTALECMLIFALFLSSIQAEVGRVKLGLVMGLCALIPYVLQRMFPALENLLLAHTQKIWLGNLGLCAMLSVLLCFPSAHNLTVFILELCFASALFFVIFQIFELRLNLLVHSKTFTSRSANTILQSAMTIGSAVGGGLAGVVLDAFGLKGVGIAGIAMSIAALFMVYCGGILLRKVELSTLAGLGGVALNIDSLSQNINDQQNNDQQNNDQHNIESQKKEFPKKQVQLNFILICVLAAAPGLLNFLLPWIVSSQNKWSHSTFGMLDFLAAGGAGFAVVICSTQKRPKLIVWFGLVFMALASALMMLHNVVLAVAASCFLWGLGMNLCRMSARQYLFESVASEKDALFWAQKLGLSRVAVETLVPILLGLVVFALPSHLFVMSALTVTVLAGIVVLMLQRNRVQ